MGKIIDFFKNKDNLYGVLIAAFFGIFGGMIPFAFDATSLVLALIVSFIMSLFASWYKESRRLGEKPKYFYMPYVIGCAIGLVATFFMWLAV